MINLLKLKPKNTQSLSSEFYFSFVSVFAEAALKLDLITTGHTKLHVLLLQIEVLIPYNHSNAGLSSLRHQY